jgi:hypothetical protein
LSGERVRMVDDPKGLVWIRSEDLGWMIGAIARIDRNVARLIGETQKMESSMAAMDDAMAQLTTQIQANTSAEASAVALIQQLATLIGANATDPATITSLAASLKTSAAALAAAISANTPQQPAPAVP